MIYDVGLCFRESQELFLTAVNFDKDRILPITARCLPHAKEAVVDVRGTDFLKSPLHQKVSRPLAKHVLGQATEEVELAEALVPSFVVHRDNTLAES